MAELAVSVLEALENVVVETLNYADRVLISRCNNDSEIRIFAVL